MSLRSLRARIFVIILLAGVIPSILMRYGILENYEEQAVELFASNLLEAGNLFLDNPRERPFIPSWNRVQAAVPDLLTRMHEAVALDNQGDV